MWKDEMYFNAFMDDNNGRSKKYVSNFLTGKT